MIDGISLERRILSPVENQLGTGRLRASLALGFVVTFGCVLAIGFLWLVIDRKMHVSHSPPQPWVAVIIWGTGLAFGFVAARRKWQALGREIRRSRGLCVHCGYSLTGNVSGICPECGQRIT